MISIVIPFLNEGVRVEKTVKSIRETQDLDVEIVLIDDNSNDDCDYFEVAQKYNCVYHYNEERQGVAGSRNVGCAMATQPNILILDAHMKMLHDDWASMLVKQMDAEPRALYCSRSCCINADWELETNMNCGGAYFRTANKYTTSFADFIQPKWRQSPSEEMEKPIVEIPIVLGAAYALKKEYWDKIYGLEGLQQYECDEYFLSAKTWLEGGRVLLMNDFQTGHFYKTDENGGQNFSVTSGIQIHNKYLCMKATMPKKVFEEHMAKVKEVTNPQEYKNGMKMVKENMAQIDEIVKKCKAIYTKRWSTFVKKNIEDVIENHKDVEQFAKRPVMKNIGFDFKMLTLA